MQLPRCSCHDRSRASELDREETVSADDISWISECSRLHQLSGTTPASSHTKEISARTLTCSGRRSIRSKTRQVRPGRDALQSLLFSDTRRPAAPNQWWEVYESDDSHNVYVSSCRTTPFEVDKEKSANSEEASFAIL
jgi:hypothetical protein